MSIVKGNSITSGFLWKFAERICAQGVSFVVSMFLARILMPEDYGIVAILLVFINLANVLVSEGFSAALIQKENADELDYSTMWICSFIISVLLYSVLFITAPLIAEFYSNALLTPTLRVLSLKLLINSFNSIQHAYVSRHMIFKKFFLSTIIGTVISAVVGITMALKGYGVWSLVAQYLVNSTIDTLVLFVTVPWRPRFRFSLSRAKGLMSYGWRVALAGLVSTGYIQLRSLIIGKIYTSSDLAFYNKGEQFPSLAVNNINTSISSVLFPAMSNCQNSSKRVKELTKSSMRLSAYVIFPMMAGLAVVAKPLISLMLTEKWLPCVPYLQLACITYALYPISTSNIQAIKAMGRSDIFLKMEIFKKSVGLILILVSMRFGTMAIAISAVVTSFFCNILNVFPNKKLLEYGYFEQLKDLFPMFINTLIMCVFIFPISKLSINSFVCLIIQTSLGIIIYLTFSKILRIYEYKYLLEKIKHFIYKK